MTVRIQPAQPDDASLIVLIAGEVWPEEILEVDAITELIRAKRGATLVAEINGRLVGFVDGFATQAVDGALRWEVDLLAVSPTAQGAGIGRGLVEASLAAGRAAGAVHARGLIRRGNAASERVFIACGFEAEPTESELWVADRLSVDQGQVLHIVPVQTFRYRGVWLEAVTEAGLHAITTGADETMMGAVIPMHAHALSKAAAAIGMHAAGHYRFWERPLL